MAYKFKIKFSKIFEVQRIWDVIKNIQWYKEKGYSVRLPEKLKEKDILLLKKISKKEVSDAVSKEYDKSDYLKIKTEIAKHLQNIFLLFKEKFFFSDYKSNSSYNINLTKYGTNGSYEAPATIIINFRDRELKNILKTITHEMVHLRIERLVSENKLDHWKKERLVDLICQKIIPDLNVFQKLPVSVNISRIDEVFHAFYPDIGRIVEEVKNI